MVILISHLSTIIYNIFRLIKFVLSLTLLRVYPLGKPHEIINTYTEAVQTVEPKLAVGKLHTLWVDFAKFYETNGQIEEARLIFEKASQVSYVKVDDLATVWCEWTEMEIRNENYDEALRLMQR